ncbi:MAG: sensor histidine kinase, partial [Sphingomonadales bacterium]|nr:sensor histidine kinase [Sphingomonadales bacterium]
RSHDLLLANNWSGSDISDIVEQAIHPFGGTDSSRINVSGPDCRLSARTSLALSMAINELGTNAAKYGALSNEQGMINIDWNFTSATAQSELELRWQESGGPQVSPPNRKGFGTTLIERALAAQMRGETAIEYLPSGVTFTCSFPVE